MTSIVHPASAAETADEQYYEVAPPRSWGERLTALARDRIYDDLIHYCRPGRDDTILDVGVSDVVNDAANVLERKYPHQGRITAAGLGEGHAFKASYPKAAYHRIEANRPLPFADKHFDIATSNAVLEHVGSRQGQEFFVREMLRVAQRVFISVPNRWFPVEHHTGIPLLHYWNASFRLACDWFGRDAWTDEANLILMSKRSLSSLAPAGVPWRAGYTGIPLGPFSSNLFILFGATKSE